MSGAMNLTELNDKMRQAGCFVRRLKADVLKELPAKTRTSIPVSITNRRDYERAVNDLVHWVADRAVQDSDFLASIADLDDKEQAKAKRQKAWSAMRSAEAAEQLVRIEALKQLAAEGKLKAVKEWVESFLESGEKLVLFAHHVAIVEELATHFNAPSITGATSMANRQEHIDRFQTDPDCKLIVMNIQAGGVGITLTAASNVAFCELAWTPAAHDQAEDRVHRIGQQDAVNAWYLLAEDTIDIEIGELLEEKRAVVVGATDGEEYDPQQSILKALLARLSKGASDE